MPEHGDGNKKELIVTREYFKVYFQLTAGHWIAVGAPTPVEFASLEDADGVMGSHEQLQRSSFVVRVREMRLDNSDWITCLHEIVI